ncbi:hypothetical protein FRC04_001942 [Tulasnella sp. 424]|nr:hypothetical protein FRC04_001942 [Tulasnella sp. 424]
MADAMGVTKKIFPTHNSPAQLADLTPVKLIELHVDSKDHRGIILKAIKTAGYVAPPGSKKGSKRKAGDVEDDGNDRAASSSSSARTKTSNKTSTPSKRPRRKEPSPALPDPDSTPPDERESVVPGGFNFDEILDEGTLKLKSTHANRAPVMTAWATVVAERMGFKREEALSIASVYTEMNAASKGVSIGIYAPSKNNEYEAGSTQPFVDLLGRNPVLEKENGQWRGLIKGTPVDPASPFGYIQRSFRQTTPAVLGAMRLLAHSYSAKELNELGYSLYCDFRPESLGWGKKAEMTMEKILALRKGNNADSTSASASTAVVTATTSTKAEE